MTVAICFAVAYGGVWLVTLWWEHLADRGRAKRLSESMERRERRAEP